MKNIKKNSRKFRKNDLSGDLKKLMKFYIPKQRNDKVLELIVIDEFDGFEIFNIYNPEINEPVLDYPIFLNELKDKDINLLIDFINSDDVTVMM